MTGRLFVCATPIGNLEDASFRLLRVLRGADVIAAEDTRRTRKLLSHYGIRGRLISFHEHNERLQVPFFLERLRKGEKVALVTDAGTPAISDPGYLIISACIDAEIPLEVIPGPSSVVAALVVSGLPTARFCFEGYLPRKAAEQKRRLGELEADERTLVVLESPNRVRDTLENVREILGNRPMALARELTKMHEEVIRGTVSEVLSSLPDEVGGEVVLVIEGASSSQAQGALESAIQYARRLAADGAPKSKAAAEAASSFKVQRRKVYEGLIEDA